ncbi:outer membrane autotransporter barrel domain-containing protein [Fusobacterium ulcerans ATCC 49185]|uniref:Outer membrane protein IcsA autotransporter n=2 Tax=Fusobacterium ulcerans TaxID=861 RepID=A0AAX2JCK1_9FUSO|nr:outer membrane autotransporter barrel domain-containing protein [Fusobacterium ulcerans ATCC 49185]SQJ09528.1 Outer membrane protein IcsA autotransporter precursor [Fusobacterium ulcerans]
MSENSARKNKMKKKILSPLLTVGIMSICIPLEDAWASSPVDYVGTVNLPASIGTGKETANDGWTVTIGNGSTPTKVTQDGKTVISVNDNAKITVKTDAAVEGNSNSNSEGHFNSGPNVIEFNSKSTLTIEAGGTVQQLGSTTNGEAINAHGFGNTIINNGTIHSNNGAALWFQDTSISVSVADRNKVVNHGTISTSKGDGYNVFGSSRGNAGPGLVFDNYGTIKGSLKFGSGDDSLLFGPGSKITGNVDGGGGTNDLTLDANSGESATLAGSVLNFSSITKDGEGAWAILGSVPAVPGDPHPSSPINGSLKEVDSLVIKKGLLSLVGANPDFNGTVNIDAPGQLSAQAQGINGATNMTNNGKLIFEQPIDDSYTGSAITGTGQVVKSGTGSLTMSSGTANTYSGGTFINEGALVVDKDSDLGAVSGSITLGTDNTAGGTNGTLRFDSSFNLETTRAITLMEGGGTIDTQGYITNIDQTIAGTGTLTKTGSGTLTLNATNSYIGGTVLQEGVLGINSDSALGNSNSRLVMYDTTTLQLNGNVDSNRLVTLAGGPSSMMTINTQANNGAFNGNIDGLGSLVKTGSGTLSLYGNNLYQGGTKVKEGTLAINSDASLGGVNGLLELERNTTLKLDGNVYMNSRPVIIGGGDNATLPQSVTIDTQGYTGVISQNIDQNAGEKTELIKTGTGTLGLYGNNTYSGGTWVKNGTVAITSPLSLGKSDVQLGDHEDTSLDGSGSTQGTLRADADIDFRGSGKSIILNKGGGTINTNGNAVILDENSLKDGIAGTASDLGRDLHKTGAGVLTLLDNQYYSGRTFIDQGILRLDAVEPNTPLSNSKGLLNTSEVTIAAGSRLEGQGIVGNSMNVQLNNSNAPVAANLTTIINNGTIAPGLERFNNTFDSTDSQFVPLTLAGNYRAGKGAAVEIHTELLDDISNHGSLTIDGVIDSASDKSGTGVVVIHQGGNGATTNHGIEIIRLRGNNSGATQADLIKQLDENFHLVSDFKTSKGQNAVVAGAYSYIMESDKDWYDNPNNQVGLFLRNATNNDGSLVPHPATPLYETYSLILGSLNKLPTLEQRIGHRPWLNDKNGYETGYDRGKTEIYPNNVWMRVEGMKGYYEPHLDSNKGSTSSYRLRFSRVNVGVDMPIYENADGSRLIAGINGNMSRAWSDIDSIHGSGDITTTGYGLGATLTWYNHNGFYTDAQAWHNWFKSDIDSNTITTDLDQVKGNHAKGYALSLEVGRIFDLNQHWSLTPQAQIAYSRVNFDSFTDIQNSVIINEKDYVGLEGRLGLALNYEKSHLDSSGKMRRNKLYILGNIHQEFKGDSTVSISGVDYESKMNNTWVSVGVGGSHNWDNDRFSIYGELSLASSTKKFGEEYELAGEIGLRIAF